MLAQGPKKHEFDHSVALCGGNIFVKLRVRVRVKVKSQKSKLDPEVGVVMG